MRPVCVLALVALAALSTTGAQSTAAQTVPCTLAERIDQETFVLLGHYDSSEVGQDTGASDYADCLAKGLTRDLSKMPALSARMATLRKLYRQLNAADGRLAYEMEGGGTMYTHAIPRSYPDIETTLKTLAALAGSKYGAQTGEAFSASLRESRQALTARLSLLRGWKPSGDYPFNAGEYRAALQAYEAAANAIMKQLGSRNDAATAAGYRPLSGSLFLDDILNNND